MSKEQFVRVGRVKDAHGIKGELFVVLFAGEAAWLEKLTQIRLVNEAPEPQLRVLAPKSIRLHKNGLIAKTEEIRDRNEAESLIGWYFEVPSELLVSEVGESIYLREIQGFRVITQAKGEVGTIAGFGTNGAQDLLLVKTAWGEFEIPFVEAYVQKIDYPASTVYMDLPEGLLGELEDEGGGDEIQ